MEVDLLDDLGVVVAELRAHHGECVVARRTAARRDQPVRGLAPGRGCGGVAVGDGRVEALDRARVDDDRALDLAAGQRPVVEVALQRRRRLRVVGQHHVFPGVVALFLAELLLEVGEQVGVGGLAAAPGAEDRADERGHRDHVVDRRRRLVDVVRLHVSVDPVGVGGGVADDLLALLAVLADEQLSLLGDERLGRGARDEALPAGDQREGVEVGDVGDRGPRRPPPERQQELAITCRRPAGAEGDVVAGLAVDVRDPVGVVDQPQAGLPRLLLVGIADRREVLGQEEVVDVGLRRHRRAVASGRCRAAADRSSCR